MCIHYSNDVHVYTIYLQSIIPHLCPIGQPATGGEGGGGEGDSGDSRTTLREQEEGTGAERTEQARQTAGQTETR